MQRLDTRKISLSGLTLTPTEGSPFQATLTLNDVPLAPSMGNWYTGVYDYASPPVSWGQFLLDDELQDIFVQVRVSGGQQEYGYKWKIGLYFYIDGYGYSQSFDILEQDGETIYENPWQVPVWNEIVPDPEDEDYPWTDYLTLSGDVDIAPVNAGSFTLPFRGLSAIEVTNADPDTFYTAISETRTFVLSGIYTFNEDTGVYVHTNPANVMDAGEVPSLYFVYDVVEGQPAGLTFKIYQIVGESSTSTVAEMGYITNVLDYAANLEDVAVEDWVSFQGEDFVGMTMRGLGGSQPPPQTDPIALRDAKYATATETGAKRFRRLVSLGYV